MSGFDPPRGPVRLRCAMVALLAGCNFLPDDLVDQSYDPDGDGVSWPEDCDSTRADRYPDAPEVPYDGIDQDCAGDDDYDLDGDGWVPDAYLGLVTEGVEGSGALPGGDCWDEQAVVGEFAVVTGWQDALGHDLAWVQPTAAEVHPEATEIWYDGVDQDCDGQNDFDRDGDGYRSAGYPDQSGSLGNDCIDGALLDEQNPAGSPAEEVNPAAEEIWYDGTDQDCDGNDCDQDGDGYDGGDGDYCEAEECDDLDAEINPEGGVVWYNGVDEACDGNDGDQDGDGYWASDYQERVSAAGGEPLEIPKGWEGDCWDEPSAVAGIPDDFAAINGFEQLDALEVNPAADETWYDGIDQDCAGDSDFDQDNDACLSDSWPDREGALGADCDDLDSERCAYNQEYWYNGVDEDCDDNDGDQDGDGYWIEGYEDLVAAAKGEPLDIPKGMGGDCDDEEAGSFPDNAEVCDGVDNDCDGETDGASSQDAGTWYADADGDGYGDGDSPVSDCSQPTGTVEDSSDCDDGDASVHPGVNEFCDEIDNDCDGLVDADDPELADGAVYFPDSDSDGFGEQGHEGELHCEQPSGWVGNDADCDDSDASALPGADEICDGVDNDCDDSVDEDEAVDAPTWYADADGDGYGLSDQVLVQCAQPSGYAALGADCDESDAAINPGASELCDGVDNDCDDSVDEDDAADAGTWCWDGDGDGFGNSASALTQCAQPSGYVGDCRDCDDGEGAIRPDASEVCDGIDNNCDGVTDGAGAEDAGTWYADADGDSYGDDGSVVVDCTQPSGTSDQGGDCDDGDAAVNPAASEVCDGIDNDCDDELDEDDATDASTWYADGDADGYGDSASSLVACSAGTGWVGDATDCDDGDAAVHPGATEVCDGIDNDCDDLLDDEDDSVDASVLATWYQDADSDGYGDASVSVESCSAPSGYVAESGDCDDGDATVNPGAAETWYDGVDSDCAGDDDYDADADGYQAEDSGGSDCDDDDAGVNPLGSEICADGIDQDCDGYDAPCAGDLLITEIMADPDALADSDGEWIEVYNATDADIDLQGLVLRDDGSDQHTIASSVAVAAGGYAVLARDSGATDDVDYVYSSFSLSNADDEVILAAYGTMGSDGEVVDEVWYDGGVVFPAPVGASISLDPSCYDEASNDDGSCWCEASSSFSTGDLGTPAADNDSCCQALLSALSPDEGLEAGGLDVTVSGSGLSLAADLSFDGVSAAFSVVSDSELTATTPAGSAGWVEVSVSDGLFSHSLEQGFLYTGLADDIDWCTVQSPSSASTTVGVDSETIYGQVYIAGITGSGSESADILAQLGYGDDGSDPSVDAGWTWADAAFNSACSTCGGSNDEYMDTLNVDTSGAYAYAYRFSYDGGANYLYCDAGGSAPSDPYEPADQASLTVDP